MDEQRRTTIPLVRSLNTVDESDALLTEYMQAMETSVFKNVVFDFGNVMVRWSPLEIIRLTFGASESTEELAKTIFQGEIWTDTNKGLLSESEAKHRFAQEFGWSLEECERLFYYIKHTQLEIYGSVDLVKRLKIAGYGIYALTDNVTEVIEHIKATYAFWELFDGTTVSADLGQLKPHADVFQAMLSQNNISAEQSVFIDDMAYNVEGAQAIGMCAIQFEHAQQCEVALKALGLDF